MLVNEEITSEIIGAAIRVHHKLGPGLLESVYEACMVHELLRRDYSVDRQRTLPIVYDGVSIDAGYRIDLLVDQQVIVEVKAVDRLAPIHEAQLLTYLRLAAKPVGLLINFNVERLRDGIIRRVLTESPDARSPLRGPPRPSAALRVESIPG